MRRLYQWLAIAAAAIAAPAAAQDDDRWATASALSAARSRAASVVVAFLDSVRQPRGSWGICPADGHVLLIERGAPGMAGQRISVDVPCATMLHSRAWLREPERRIPMRFLHSRTFARIYFDDRGRMVDYEALRLSPEPTLPGW
jgi:hypothetical protein